jgi:ribokinase
MDHVRHVVVVGSLNADLVVRLERFPAAGETVAGTGFAVHPGGKGANQAVAAAKLRARVFMVGRVGRDGSGRLLRESLAAAGVDLRHLRDDPEAPTGTALVEIDAAGQNRIVVVPGANGQVVPEDVDAAEGSFDPETLVLLQLEVPLPVVERALALARRRGARTILDPAPARPEAAALLGLADYLTPNETELAALVGEPPARGLEQSRRQARALLDRGAGAVVAKRGAEGALLVRKSAELFWSAPTVSAVDSTAAGDAWNGAFAAALASGRREEEAGRLATDAASFSVTRAGAQPSMPTLEELADFCARPRGMSREVL